MLSIRFSASWRVCGRRRIVPLELVRAREREERLERLALVAELAVVREQVERRRRLAVGRESVEDPLPQRERLRVIRHDRRRIRVRGPARGFLERQRGLEVGVRLIEVEVRELEHLVRRELLVRRVVREELLEERDRVRSTLDLSGLGGRDLVGVSARQLAGAVVVLVARDLAHPRVVGGCRDQEALVLLLDIAEILELLGGQRDRRREIERGGRRPGLAGRRLAGRTEARARGGIRGQAWTGAVRVGAAGRRRRGRTRIGARLGKSRGRR